MKVWTIGAPGAATELARAGHAPAEVGAPEGAAGLPPGTLDPRLERSYAAALAAEGLAQRGGPPDLILAAAESALPYFLIQRRLTDGGPLGGVPVAVLDSDPPLAARRPSYRLPDYWVGRLERFCLAAADAALPARPADLAAACAAAAAGFRPPEAFPAGAGAALPRRPEEREGLLSVVVPFYNLGRYVGETLDSLAASTYRPLEVIVLDDGSAPEERALLDAAAARHGGLVRVVRTENGGLARARNAGAEAAGGELLAFVDADDVVEPAFFARAAAVLRRFPNVSFAYAWMRLFDGADGVVPTWNAELPLLLAYNMVGVMLVLRRADFLARGRNNPAMVGAREDHEAWVRMVAAGCVGVSIPEPLVRYRIRPGSMLRSASEERQADLLQLISELHPELFRHYGAELFNLQSANGRALRWEHPAVPTPDDRARAEAAEAAYARLRSRLGALDPLLGLARRLRRGGGG